MVHKLLAHHPSDVLLEPLRTEMLECMDANSLKSLDIFFSHMEFSMSEYVAMDKNLAGTPYIQVKKAIASRIPLELLFRNKTAINYLHLAYIYDIN